MESPEFRSFVDAALAWLEEPSERHVRRMLRSPYSGVAHEVAAAIVTLTPEGGTIAHTLASGRVALPAVDRDAVFAFTARLDALDRSEPTGRESIVCEAFGVAAAATPSLETPFELALQPPREPETSVTLRPRQSHFSASSLNAYVECARKWFYRYCCAAVEDKGSAASFYGTAFHAALEDFHGAYPHPSDASASELRTRLDACINTSFDAFRERFGSAIAFELQRRRARRTGRRYVDWLAAQAARAPFTVLGCELPAQMELEGYAFIGYIDRLDRDDATGAVSVIDYKTGSIATTAEEYRESVRAFQEFQLPFYYWARTAEGDRVSTLSLVPLKDALLDVAPISLEVVPVPTAGVGARSTRGVISIGELEAARARMIALARELSGGTLAHFAPTTDPQACRYCAYANACNLRPAPAEERFAR